MADWLDVDSLVFAGTSLAGIIFSAVARSDDKAVKNLQNIPKVEVGPAVEGLISNKTTIPYVAIRGAVKALNPNNVLKSESGVKGVLQVIQVNEHSMRRYSTGFWGDSVREIVHTVSDVPFGLKTMTGTGPSSMVVEIVDPLQAVFNNLLSPVSTKFTPSTPGLASTVFGFFAGNSSTGIETTEKLLAIDSNITAVGQLSINSGKLRLSTPMDKSSFPYILSSFPLEHIIETMLLRRAGYRMLAAVFYGVAAFFGAKKAWKLWKIYEEKKMRERIQRERRERISANRANNPNNTQETSNTDVHLCIICLTNPREVILLPCGHVLLCADCLERMDRICPLCRLPFTGTHVAYIS